jgi:hypothetical protein
MWHTWMEWKENESPFSHTILTEQLPFPLLWRRPSFLFSLVCTCCKIGLFLKHSGLGLDAVKIFIQSRSQILVDVWSRSDDPDLSTIFLKLLNKELNMVFPNLSYVNQIVTMTTSLHQIVDYIEATSHSLYSVGSKNIKYVI